MKRIFAVLLSCIMITAAFSSCGKNKDKDKDEKNKKSVSDSKDKDKKDKDKDDDEDDDSDKDKDNNDESSESSKKKSKKDKEKSSDKSSESDGKKSSTSDGSIYGEWVAESAGMDVVFNFTENGVLKAAMSLTDTMHFEGYKFNMSGVEADYTYDGSKIDVNMNGQSMIVLERTDGKNDTSSIDGEYILTGGAMSDSISYFLPSTVSGLDFGFVIDGENLAMSLDIGEFSVNGDELTFENLSDFGIDIAEQNNSCKFEVSGDELKLYAPDGSEDTVLHRP